MGTCVGPRSAGARTAWCVCGSSGPCLDLRVPHPWSSACGSCDGILSPASAWGDEGTNKERRGPSGLQLSVDMELAVSGAGMDVAAQTGAVSGSPRSSMKPLF